MGRHGYSGTGEAGQWSGGRFRGQPRAAVPAGDPQQRPPAQRDPRAAIAAAGFLSLFRRARAVAPRRGHPRRRLVPELYPAQADRHRRQLHSVQSPADDHVQVARGGAGERMRHRGQAVGIYSTDDAEAGANLHRGWASSRRVQCRAPVLAKAPAGCSPNTPISTNWC